MMSEENQNKPKTPTHTVYFTKMIEGNEKAEWIKTGSAWEHGDKEGLNLSLTVFGQKVALTVRKNKPRD
jgi:hypothetical protein